MANRMRELRLEHHETQRDLAELLGLKSAVLYCKRERVKEFISKVLHVKQIEQPKVQKQRDSVSR